MLSPENGFKLKVELKAAFDQALAALCAVIDVMTDDKTPPPKKEVAE